MTASARRVAPPLPAQVRRRGGSISGLARPARRRSFEGVARTRRRCATRTGWPPARPAAGSSAAPRLDDETQLDVRVSRVQCRPLDSNTTASPAVTENSEDDRPPGRPQARFFGPPTVVSDSSLFFASAATYPVMFLLFDVNHCTFTGSQNRLNTYRPLPLCARYRIPTLLVDEISVEWEGLGRLREI